MKNRRVPVAFRSYSASLASVVKSEMYWSMS